MTLLKMHRQLAEALMEIEHLKRRAIEAEKACAVLGGVLAVAIEDYRKDLAALKKAPES